MGTERDKYQSKSTHLEHTLRAKDKEIDHLKQKLRERLEREDRRHVRDKDIYDKLRKKVSRQNAGSVSAVVRELRPVEIVGIYESQREVLESELTGLRTELHEVKKSLAEKEDYIRNKDMVSEYIYFTCPFTTNMLNLRLVDGKLLRKVKSSTPLPLLRKQLPMQFINLLKQNQNPRKQVDKLQRPLRRKAGRMKYLQKKMPA